MSRAFGIVEDKVEETEFFLSKLITELNEHPYGMLKEAQYYLSAFVAAARSITFTIQASISDIDGFKEWYGLQQSKLKENKLAGYFLEARNLSQKIGYYLIGGGRFYKDEQGRECTQFYFQAFLDDHLKYVPEEDVRKCCITYFKILLGVVMDCYKTFGREIDPELFFTYENMLSSHKTIEDFEEQAGYPRGYTDIPGFTIKQRVELLQQHHPKPQIDWIFNKYLGVNRFGEVVKNS